VAGEYCGYTPSIFCVSLGLSPIYGQVVIISVSLWVSEKPCYIWLFISVGGSYGSASLWQVLVSQRWCQYQCHMCFLNQSWIMSCFMRLFDVLCVFLVLCAGIVTIYICCNQ
jgi:hypothetical protein